MTIASPGKRALKIRLQQGAQPSAKVVDENLTAVLLLCSGGI